MTAADAPRRGAERAPRGSYLERARLDGYDAGFEAGRLAAREEIAVQATACARLLSRRGRLAQICGAAIQAYVLDLLLEEDGEEIDTGDGDASSGGPSMGMQTAIRVI